MRIYWGVLAMTCFTISLDAPGTSLNSPVLENVGEPGEVCVLEIGPNPEMVAKSYFRAEKGRTIRKEIGGSISQSDESFEMDLTESEYLLFMAGRVRTVVRKHNGQTVICAFLDTNRN